MGNVVKPEFVTFLADKNVTRGERVILLCEANIEKVPATWEKDGSKLLCVEGKHKVYKIGNTFTLEILNADETDEGKYTLTLSNTAGSASCSAFIRVVFESYRLEDEEGSFPFAFYDIMGAEAEEKAGVNTQDIISALKGHVKEGYKFNSNAPLSESDSSFYNRNPSLGDQMHCLVNVIAADKISLMSDEFIKKWKTIRETASSMGIPQVVFMTRADCECKITKENLQNIYKSKKIRDKKKLSVSNYCFKYNVGGGNSSTINTIKTIFEGRQLVDCLAAALAETSHTKRFDSFEILEKYGSFPFTFHDTLGVQAQHSVHINDIIAALKGHLEIRGTFIKVNVEKQCFFLNIFQYESFRLEDEEGSFPFAFYDVMGAEAEEKAGVNTQDIISALKGHMKEGYKFHSNGPLSESDSSFYNRNPSLGDQMHCLVNVIAADKISLMKDEFIKKWKTIRETACSMGIPQRVFMTRADCECKITKENLQNIYKSKKIRDKIIQCSNLLGVPVNLIFPVVNYNKETNVNTDINCLMLDALKNIVPWANDYVKKRSNKQNLHQQPKIE
ncbi:interferon-induced protein 44 [Silurus asotus]|uniref:Interferon-induced protein 44 n=1 Tax=Silurus asotus TaxID=30991 RepID=A0AAD5FTZ7_SILAS|nr:interferon-induced protein 44 [Silurus asotus]